MVQPQPGDLMQNLPEVLHVSGGFRGQTTDAPGPGRATKLYALIRDSDKLFPNLSSFLCVCVMQHLR